MNGSAPPQSQKYMEIALAEAAEAALEEGENRLELALHYRIAYDRMAHLPLSGGGDVKHVLPPADFAATTLERFQNPFLEHALSDIAMHHGEKIEVRLTPTRSEFVERFGRRPSKLDAILAQPGP